MFGKVVIVKAKPAKTVVKARAVARCRSPTPISSHLRCLNRTAHQGQQPRSKTALRTIAVPRKCFQRA
eukprot:6881100-Alexandrium_andersonii.AAC.1